MRGLIVLLPVLLAMVLVIKPEQGQVRPRQTVELRVLRVMEVTHNLAVQSVQVRTHDEAVMNIITSLPFLKVDCDWAAWGAWSACTKRGTCGVHGDGDRQRTRVQSIAVANVGGVDCEATSMEDNWKCCADDDTDSAQCTDPSQECLTGKEINFHRIYLNWQERIQCDFYNHNLAPTTKFYTPKRPKIHPSGVNAAQCRCVCGDISSGVRKCDCTDDVCTDCAGCCSTCRSTILNPPSVDGELQAAGDWFAHAAPFACTALNVTHSECHPEE